MNSYQLKLFITGMTSRSESAIGSIKKICAENLEEFCELEIVNVLDEPERAEEAKILATPTLIKISPPPVKRLVGDLSDIELVKKHLDIK